MQRTLEFPPTDPNLYPDDAARVSGQARKVLERLQRGPATNFELNTICLRYGARIFDLKAKGYRIKSTRVGGAEWKFELQ